MNFNPLFIQPATIDEASVNSIKQIKLNDNSYLFSDIIKLNYEKSTVGQDDFLSSANLSELNAAMGFGANLNHTDAMNNLVGMPSLEMFTIVEPKILNSLVEKVFQSNNTLGSNEGLFALNSNVKIETEIKSEIYGSEEKLVEFLEQLMPGMVMLDTNQTQEYKLAQSSEQNLNLLPLPESNTVITDVLKRLKAGQTVQILAKVGDEKIKLDIQKIENVGQDSPLFKLANNKKFSELELPEQKTASASTTKEGAAAIVTSDELVPEAKKATIDTASTPLIKMSGENKTVGTSYSSEENNIIKSDVAANPKSTLLSDITGALEAKKVETKASVTNANVRSDFKAEIKTEIKAEVAGMKTESTGASEAKITPQIDSPDVQQKDFIKVNDAVADTKVASSESEVKTTPASINEGTEIKEPAESGFEQKAVETSDIKISDDKLPKISRPKVDHNPNTTEIQKTPTPEVEKKNLAEPVKVAELEVARMAMLSKSFAPLKKHVTTDAKEEKYKIEITQESVKESAPKIIKDSNLTVGNYMNFKKQTEKTEQTLKTEKKENNSEELKMNVESKESATLSKQAEGVKLEVSAEKSTPQHKVNGQVELAGGLKTFENAEKAMKIAMSGKEVYKTAKSSELVQQVKTFMQNGETKTLILKLMPENLGKVKVMLDLVDNKMQTSIEVESESIKQMVMNNMDTLKQALAQSGVQVGSFNISLSQQDQKMKREFAGKKKEEGGESSKLNVGEVSSHEIAKKKMGYNTYEFTA
ncbi:MAG: flagellar hook-length control protein FliK [Bacteroidetes bacterium]|nr:flagellar hook-length control protein FliK [Bacteroidota bacterium]